MSSQSEPQRVKDLRAADTEEIARLDALATRVPHAPQRGDDVEAWLRRMRNRFGGWVTAAERERFEAVDGLLNRYRECADYGLTLRPEDDDHGD